MADTTRWTLQQCADEAINLAARMVERLITDEQPTQADDDAFMAVTGSAHAEIFWNAFDAFSAAAADAGVDMMAALHRQVTTYTNAV